ncbi:MAG: hypothetical protein QXR48_02190 [Candidatus Woesearchaeota archaeon]
MARGEDYSNDISDFVRENPSSQTPFSNSIRQGDYSRQKQPIIYLTPRRNRDYRSRHCDYDKGMR